MCFNSTKPNDTYNIFIAHLKVNINAIKYQ